MSRKVSNQTVRNVCEYCHTVFQSKAPARFCVKNSSCRVKYHLEQKKKRAIERELNLDLDTMVLYVDICAHYPDHVTAINTLLTTHGNVVHKHYMTLIYSMLHPDQISPKG